MNGGAVSSVDQSSWHVDGHHWVSPINYESIRQPSIDLPEPLRIYDYTLAKMIYTPGVSPPIKDMLRVAAALEEAGRSGPLRLTVRPPGGDPSSSAGESLRVVL